MREYIKLKGVVKFSQGIQIPIEDQSLNKMNGSVRFVRIVDYTKSGGEPPRYINSCNDKYLVNDEDVVMIRYGSKTAGQVARGISGAIANNMFQIKILDESKLDKNYLYWYLAQESTYQRLNGSQSSSTMPAITFGMIGDFEIPVLDIKDQKKLSEMFSIYQNLIENNNRRIAILEEMAQSLYREWFVNFRYPGHADTVDASLDEKQGNPKLIDSALGQIPEGWEVKDIGSIAKVKGGKRLPKGKKVLDENTDFPYLRVTDFKEFGLERSKIKFIDEESHKANKRYVISIKDVYISIAGTIGRVGIIPSDLDGSNLTENAAKICDFIDPYWQLYVLRFLRSYMGQKTLMARTSGSSQPKLALYKISEMPLLLPPENLLTKFTYIASNLEQLIENLDKKNDNLNKQRDMLLPKLISGQIEL
tara:strand:- start:14558 stop:15817 length:1260 start_codon:yes stop_codon:yes gene_type:complete